MQSACSQFVLRICTLSLIGKALKDSVGIYDSTTWELIAHFALDSYDCVEISWSPDNTCVIFADTQAQDVRL